ncbi:MAG: hypothetical protein AB7J30_12565 [Hyphomicrobium sp.]|uniref:hypothetical protein n=1 Tax=Hyphomicrobium sp. TaxID=82 RepID=UPI003D13AF6A
MTVSNASRKDAEVSRKGAPPTEPPAADYSDEVSIEQLGRLKEKVADLEMEDWPATSGPAW